MSYILEALKRADAERGQTRTLNAPLVTPLPRMPTVKRRVFRILLLMVGLVAVLVAGGWWLYSRNVPSEHHSSLPETTAANSTTSGFEPAPATPVATVASDLPTVPAAPVLPIFAPAPPSPPIPPRPSAPTNDNRSLAQASVAPPSDLIDNTAPSNATARPDVATAAPELPAAPPPLSVRDQAGLPKVQISGSSYSANPEHRILIANGQVVKEGQEVSPGLTLEVIGPRSAVFNHRGTRYNINY